RLTNYLYVKVRAGRPHSQSLSQALIDAENNGGKRVITKVDEIELLNRVGNGRNDTVGVLVRYGWDSARWGQRRVGLEERQQHSGPQNLLNLLPDEFTYEEFIQLRKSQSRSGDGKSTLRTWKTRGYIDFDEVTNTWVKR
ncbi:MAG: hypothetical protein ACI4B3_03985, partial [Prevotella sp.]